MYYSIGLVTYLQKFFGTKILLTYEYYSMNEFIGTLTMSFPHDRDALKYLLLDETDRK